MNNKYLQKAYEIIPELYEKAVFSEASEYILKSGESKVFDFGTYGAGYLSFDIKRHKVYLDAPVRLSIKFCETKRELDDDFSKYNGGLCSSWLQEEIVTFDYAGEYKLPRRYAAGFVKITVLATPQEFVLKNICFTSVTSADENTLKKVEISDEKLREIDRIGVNTLKNCMQRVFEDGPKRDRRLWLGDLRLEALANYYTFGNIDLVKRCLYLFAACDKNSYGLLPTHVYDYPEFYNGDWMCGDYALLFCCSLCDLYHHTGDKETFLELYEVAKSQIDACVNALDEDGIIKSWELGGFIDWCPNLVKQTSLQGVLLYVLDNLCSVLEKLSHDDLEKYSAVLEELRIKSRKQLFDCEKGLFKAGKDNYQYSVHSVVWMILGGVISGEEAKNMLTRVLSNKDIIKPFTPYMHHYVVEALIKLEMLDKAKEYIKNYWGIMVEKGADTFYEVFVPEDNDFSPYGDRMINSGCHAWSCTPTYFIRKYFV